MGMKKLNVRIDFFDENTQRKDTVEKTFVMKKWREDAVVTIALDVYNFFKAEGKKFANEETIEFANGATLKVLDGFFRIITDVDGVTGTTKCDAALDFIVRKEEKYA